ncbi:MAG: hypothetical protein RLZZ292_2422 [Bacteroidota bacterium]|jgi:phage gpG-like protein
MTNTFTTILNRYESFRHKVPTIIGTEAVKFAKSNFVAQGFQNQTVSRWDKRAKETDKNKKQTRAILVKTGRLKQSIRITRTTSDSVTIGSEVPYAQIHNEGGTITATANIRQHRRRVSSRDRYQARQGKTGKRSSRVHFDKSASGISFVSAHTRNINTKLPQRKYIGPSATLNKHIQNAIAANMLKIFR